MAAEKKPTLREQELLKQLEELRTQSDEQQVRLEEAEETLRAIREGEVDAVIVSGTKGEQVFSLLGTDSIYRLIVETMKEAAFTVTFDGKILFCNAQFGRLLKRPLELVVGHPLGEFVAENNQAAAASLLVATQQQPVKQRLVFQDLNCMSVPAHVSANVLNQPDGLSICVVASDLTDLENSTELIGQLARQQEALRQSEATFRSVLDNARDVIYRLNVQTGRYDYMSPSVEEVVDFTAEELMAMDAKAAMGMIHPDDMPVMQAALAELEETGQAEAEYRQRAKNADYRWLSNRMSLARDGDGRPLYRDGNIRDITARKQAEEELRQTAVELVRSNKDLEQFAYVASHDLQEPLRQVTNFMALLQSKYKGQLDDKAQEFIGFAVDGATRMSALIKDLLEYSKVGAQGKQPAPVDLTAVAEYVKANLQATIEESDAAITADPLPTIMADAGQMRQLFQNLLGNAIKFHVPGRRPEIHIGARQDGGQWVFHVKDNGIGIDPKQSDRLFKLFQRLHGRDKYPGTGIGLAICKKIVESHGGRIWVESKIGEGSTFYFTIPGRD